MKKPTKRKPKSHKSSRGVSGDRLYGMLGWREFLQNRSDLLSAYDRAKVLTTSRPISTEHGPVAEAAIRKWFGQFLPKRYAVTSGFIIPNITDIGDKLYHYDVIVYDQLLAPVLWASSSDDQSDQGKVRAIPAKYVVSVYEVKASLTNDSAKAAAEKLVQLASLREHLVKTFTCGAIFFDLPPSQNHKVTILGTIAQAAGAPGFWGGTILRTACDPYMTAILVAGLAAEGAADGYEGSALVKPVDEVDVYRSGTDVKVGPGASVRFTRVAGGWEVTKTFHANYTSSGLLYSCIWSHSGFSDFAMQVLNGLEGIHYWSHAGQRSNKFAQVFDRLEERLA